MRAVVLSEFGPAGNLRLSEVPDPEPGPGQVLIDVEIANITFIETQLRAGHAPNPAMLPRLPVIPGNGVGGVITAADTAGLIGQRVVTSTGGSGGYAELAVVDAASVVSVPAGLDIADAVALLADGRTALALMSAAKVAPGETVLVEAAAGGVGSLLVQLARAAGATVIGAAGGRAKLAVAASLGAVQVVDYTVPGWADQLPGGVDVVFDGVGGPIGQAAFGLVRPGGRFCAFGLASGSFTAVPADAPQRGVEVVFGVQVTPERARSLTADALGLAAAGQLRPLIGQRYPLDRAADAHAAMESRATTGKTLLTVN
jgi:NADPH:quinone reductase